MKISSSDGAISCESGSIRRNQDRMQFLDSPIGKSATQSFVNEDWRHYNFEPESGVAGTIFFKGDRMDRVFLLMKVSNKKGREWTEELELERKASHDSWLRAELGEPPYEYSWGSVTSDYDPRGCVSEIIVTYDE